MRQTWRWFCPDDPVTLAHIRQAGAEGIVTALHEYTPGQVWPAKEIEARKSMIEASGLTWDVCESIWMPDAIKLKGSAAKAEVAAWVETILSKIVDGEFSKRSKLPTENTHSEQLHFSRPVLRQALKQLRADGFITFGSNATGRPLKVTRILALHSIEAPHN